MSFIKECTTQYLKKKQEIFLILFFNEIQMLFFIYFLQCQIPSNRLLCSICKIKRGCAFWTDQKALTDPC